MSKVFSQKYHLRNVSSALYKRYVPFLLYEFFALVTEADIQNVFQDNFQMYISDWTENIETFIVSTVYVNIEQKSMKIFCNEL